MKAFKTGVAILLASALTQVFANSVEDRKAVMDSQIELLRKEAELNEALRRVAGSAAISLPSIVSISRMGANRIARLQFSNGTMEYFREGEMIRPGMKVALISQKQVLVAVDKGKKKVELPLEFAAVNANGVPGMPGMMGAPGVPGAPGSNVPVELLPTPPSVTVPAIEIIPRNPPPAKAPAAAQPGNTPASAQAH